MGYNKEMVKGPFYLFVSKLMGNEKDNYLSILMKGSILAGIKMLPGWISQSLTV